MLTRFVPFDTILFVIGLGAIAVLLGVDVLALVSDLIGSFLSPDWWPF